MACHLTQRHLSVAQLIEIVRCLSFFTEQKEKKGYETVFSVEVTKDFK